MSEVKRILTARKKELKEQIDSYKKMGEVFFFARG